MFGTKFVMETPPSLEWVNSCNDFYRFVCYSLSGNELKITLDMVAYDASLAEVEFDDAYLVFDMALDRITEIAN